MRYSRKERCDMKRNVLVFPCGSEIGLEVYRSLKNSVYFHLVGASSVDDHGKFVFEDCVGNLPYMTDSTFITQMRNVVREYHIDAIYPAVDVAITYLKQHEAELGCLVVTSCLETVELCLSKNKTYETLKDVIRVPKTYHNVEEIRHYPVFGKFDVGHSAIGTLRLDDQQMVEDYIVHHENAVICEYLPGDEYTVDCFSDKKGRLLFYGPRRRVRIKNGISVNTVPIKDEQGEFKKLIEKINAHIRFRGAWFAQFKRNMDGELTLLEIAARLGGSSSLFRAKGINFAQLSLFDAFDYPVSVVENDYEIELDRALDNVYRIDVKYDEVFVDFDDCLLLEKKYVNTELVAFLFHCLNAGKKLTLLTHHERDIYESLKKIRLENLFDKVIHIDRSHPKSNYIDNKNSIFIDDSYAERSAIAKNVGIPVFGLDMIKHLSDIR